MPIAELQTPDTLSHSSRWFTPALPEQQIGQHDVLLPITPPIECDVTERQVQALREWRERGEYLDHLVSLIDKGHSMSFDNFASPERLAEETVPLPIFEEIAGRTFSETFPNGVEETYPRHSGQLLLENSELPTEIVAPVSAIPAARLDEAVAAQAREGRHALRRPVAPEDDQRPSTSPASPPRPSHPGPSGPPSPTPAQPRPIPFEQPGPKQEPKNETTPERATVSRKLHTRHLGAATMRLVRRLGLVIPRKSQQARSAIYNH
jgi:hypothetical protein